LPRTRRTGRKPPQRTVALLRSPSVDGVGAFRISDGKEAALYAFHEIFCEIGGRGFALHRLGLGNLYHVRLGVPEECSCECLGFLRHGRCRHILGMLALIRKGEI